MRKAVIVFFFIILFVQVGYAQDIIFFRNKTTVNAKIMGLSQRNISYKQYENQQGVLYATPISKIDSVKWESGEVSIYPLLHPAIKKKGYEIALELGMREQFNMNYLSSDAKYYRPVISSFIGVSQMYRFNPYVAVGGYYRTGLFLLV
ncbi:MAG: hypothetical protein LBG80_01360 [Bacteroidales bacterium]|jgi:hypothetical protein|nr:hypothetical protein [Bacteroidales bacterium]